MVDASALLLCNGGENINRALWNKTSQKEKRWEEFIFLFLFYFFLFLKPKVAL
jgi:uncharacterized membrane protein HdeD (DUF308 family)